MKKNIVFTVILTLIAGFLLGFFVRGEWIKRELRSWKEPSTMKERMFERLELSKEQQAIVEPILKEFGKKHRAVLRLQRQEFHAINKALFDTLSAHLSDEQLERLRRLPPLRMRPPGEFPNENPPPHRMRRNLNPTQNGNN